MNITYVLVFFLSFCLSGKGVFSNPCNNYQILDSSKYRGTKCLPLTHKRICDRYIKPGWYRVEGDAEIVTEPTELFRCATTYPMWMKGELTTQADVQNATVCITKRPDLGCHEEIEIQVQMCTGYYVYFLHPTSYCETAYCFGLNETCPSFEPCDFYYHETINFLDETNVCNLASGWYLLKSSIAIGTVCPSSPNVNVWINETQILPGDISHVQLCLRGEESCCQYSIDLQVKNCSGSLAFNVSSSQSCFCTGECSFNVGSSCRKTQLESIFLFLIYILVCWYY